jgi:hypothetical protein
MENTQKQAVKNTADPEQVKKAAEKEKQGYERDLDDVRKILATDYGRRFFWRYLGICGVFRTSFTGNSHTFFNEGERNIGLRLLEDVNNADPTAYVKMVNEREEIRK